MEVLEFSSRRGIAALAGLIIVIEREMKWKSAGTPIKDDDGEV